MNPETSGYEPINYKEDFGKQLQIIQDLSEMVARSRDPNFTVTKNSDGIFDSSSLDQVLYEKAVSGKPQDLVEMRLKTFERRNLERLAAGTHDIFELAAMAVECASIERPDLMPAFEIIQLADFPEVAYTTATMQSYILASDQPILKQSELTNNFEETDGILPEYTLQRVSLAISLVGYTVLAEQVNLIQDDTEVIEELTISNLNGLYYVNREVRQSDDTYQNVNTTPLPASLLPYQAELSEPNLSHLQRATDILFSNI